jgi:hypothetical protein
MNKAAPSPMLSPSRFLLIGLLIVRDSELKASNPFNVSSHSASTPPVTTASQNPEARRLWAEANALALAEQAVDTVYAGP